MVPVERPLVVLPFQALEAQVVRHREVPMRQQQEVHPLLALVALVGLPYQVVPVERPLVVLPFQALEVQVLRPL